MIRRRMIIVPNSKEAEYALNYDKARKNQLTELLLNDEDFYLLYKENIFALINDIANTNIDDYEDDSIKDVDNIIRVINGLELKGMLSTPKVAATILKIKQLFEKALKRGTGVYFFL